MLTLPKIRKQIRTLRRATAPKVREQLSSIICQNISDLDCYRTANRVAAYIAFDGEADPMQLMMSAVEQGKQVYLPIIVGKSKPLAFAAWTPATLMINNRFDIPEPKVESTQLITADQLDFVISPLVAFDEQCNRIGVGGGFYDRTFAFLNEPDCQKSVQLVGFAFELQKLPAIEPEEWDIRLDAVATERKIYR